jgi:hypothetical protein
MLYYQILFSICYLILCSNYPILYSFCKNKQYNMIIKLSLNIFSIGTECSIVIYFINIHKLNNLLEIILQGLLYLIFIELFILFRTPKYIN